MVSAGEYIDELQANGRFSFTTDEAVAALGVSVPAARAAVRRLKAIGVVVAPFKGFHVVIPPAYRRIGCLPAEQFVPDLMQHIGQPYYVGLLSAARYHGAGHQAPMVFQVIVPASRREVECGRVRVDFIARHDMEATPVVDRNTPAGVIRVATAAATALEVVGYPQHCGYLDNVATVLAELAESVDRDELVAEARRAPLPWVQRLGYLLNLVEADDLADCLDAVIDARGAFPVALAPWRDMAGARRDRRWNLAVNIDVEPES